MLVYVSLPEGSQKGANIDGSVFGWWKSMEHLRLCKLGHGALALGDWWMIAPVDYDGLCMTIYMYYSDTSLIWDVLKILYHSILFYVHVLFNTILYYSNIVIF